MIEGALFPVLGVLTAGLRSGLLARLEVPGRPEGISKALLLGVLFDSSCSVSTIAAEEDSGGWNIIFDY